jgi:hippurate hydrolase
MKKFLVFCFGLVWVGALQGQSLSDQIKQDYPYLEKLYIQLHQSPELSLYEKNTAKQMAAELKQIGFTVTENFGGTSVVGVLSNGPGPTVLVRADMDGLPILEETGRPYASKVTTVDESGKTVSVMHGCGHDIHMTVWTGAARALVKNKNLWSGTLVFIGQSAEERSVGAKAMLEEGLYQKFPKPDYCLSLHVHPTLEAGKIGYRYEYALANVDFIDITVYGVGGHGAYPHLTKDPIVLAARIVTTLQTIVSRETSPLEPAVVTVGSIHGGAKANVIPNEVKMELTMRSYSDKVRTDLVEKIRRICLGEAIAGGFPEDKYPKVVLRTEETPSTYNTPALTERMIGVYRRVLGVDKVEEVLQSMAGEDFARFGRTPEKIPSFLFWLGTVDPEKAAAAANGGKQLPPLHSSFFAPVPQPSITTGVMGMTSAVMDLLPVADVKKKSVKK